MAMIAGSVLGVIGLLLIGAGLTQPRKMDQRLVVFALGLSCVSVGAAYLVISARPSPDILLLAAIGLGLVALLETGYLISAEWARLRDRYRRTRRLARLLLYGFNASLFGILVSVVLGLLLQGSPSILASYVAIVSIMGLVVAVPPLAQLGVTRVQAPTTIVVLLAAAGLALIPFWLGGIGVFQASCLAGTVALLGLAYLGGTRAAAEIDTIADTRYVAIQVVLSSSAITVVFAGLAVHLLMLNG